MTGINNSWSIGDVLMTLGTGGMYGAMKLAAPSVYGLRNQFEVQRQKMLGDLGIQQHQQQMQSVQDYIFNQTAHQGPVDPNMEMMRNPALTANAMMQQPSTFSTGASMLRDLWSNARAQNKAQQWTPQQILEQTTKQYTEAQKATADTRNRLQYFADTTALLNERGGFGQDVFHGTDDLALINNFSKLLRPNEAVMSDDVRNVMRTLGFKDSMKAFENVLVGGQLTETQRKQVYQTMLTLAKEANTKNKQQREMITNRIKSTPLDINQILQPAIGLNPGNVSRGTPDHMTGMMPPPGFSVVKKTGLIDRGNR